MVENLGVYSVNTAEGLFPLSSSAWLRACQLNGLFQTLVLHNYSLAILIEIQVSGSDLWRF